MEERKPSALQRDEKPSPFEERGIAAADEGSYQVRKLYSAFVYWVTTLTHEQEKKLYLDESAHRLYTVSAVPARAAGQYFDPMLPFFLAEKRQPKKHGAYGHSLYGFFVP